MFTHEDGSQLNSDQLRWRCKVAFREAGFPDHDVYCMRHTFASIMDDKGMEHRTIADLMGHANVNTFEIIYRHRLRLVVTEAAKAIANVWDSAA